MRATVRTASEATAVQIVHGKRRGARRIEHIDAHLTVVLAALAVSRLVEERTG